MKKGTLESQLSPTLIFRTIFILQVCDPNARRRRAQSFAARVRHYGSICHPLGIRDVNMHIMYYNLSTFTHDTYLHAFGLILWSSEILGNIQQELVAW